MSVERSTLDVEHSAPRGAVFLSYASQDAEAAERIADALRAAGVEVWFDKSELAGGDAWDAKIRDQIQSCTLFVPVISASTQARPEGYFRLEWKLAVDRSHLMSEDHPFLFPVVIDDTPDSTARVPGKFRERQWMRLDKTTPAAIASRLATVLTGEPAPTQPATPAALPRPTPHPTKPSRPWLIPTIVGVIALAAVAVWQFGPPPSTENLATASASSSAPIPGSEAAQLLADAWELINRPDEDLADLTLADDYLTQANQLDPDSADIWAAWSQVDTWLGYHNFDNSDTRQQSARNKVTQAMKRAPHSFEARLAQACFHVRGAGNRNKWKKQNLRKVSAETEATLQVLLKEQPEEPRTLYALGILQRNLDREDEAIDTLERLSQHPAWAATAWNEIGWIYWLEDYPAALEAANRSIAIHPFRGNLSIKIFASLIWVGDLDAALHALNQMPNEVLLSDWGAAQAVWVYQFRREPDQALTLLKSISRDWLSDNMYEGPKRLLTGKMHDLAGRHGAARIDFQAALRQVEQRLVEDSSDARLYALKGDLLARLDQKEEARAILRLGRELEGKPLPAGEDPLSALQSGDWDRALDDLERLAAEKNLIEISAALLRLHPKWDPLRELPRFQALLAKLEADPFFSPHAPTADQATLPPAVAEIPAKSIAVLPFANRSNREEDAFFTDGIHDDLLTQISRIRDIKTISRTSVLTYRDTTKNMRTIGRELGVAHLLEGGVQRSGSRVRINMQLIDAATDTHLWAETYTRELTAENVFDIQSEIAAAIAAALQAVLSPEEQAQNKKLPTQNMAALEAYFRGRNSYILNTSQGYSDAIESFHIAIKHDPNFAKAYAQLALATLAKIYYGGLSPEQQISRADPWIKRALELDPNLSEAHQALGRLKRYERDPKMAEKAFQRAITLNPNNASAYAMWGNMKTWVERDSAAAIPLARKAVALDPRSIHAKSQLGEALRNANRFNEARQVIEAVISESPNSSESHNALGGLLRRGLFQKDEAVRAYRQAIALDPGSAASSNQLASAYLDLGMIEEGIFWIERSLVLGPHGQLSQYSRGLLHDIKNEPEKMVTVWESAIRETILSTDRTWINLGLIWHDINRGAASEALARVEQFYPELAPPVTHLEQQNTNHIFQYACALLAAGKNETAQPYVEAYLAHRDATHRLTFEGVGYGDAALFLLQGDETATLDAIKAWRALGGREDLSEHPLLARIQDNPEFQALNNEMRAELAEQRANVERWEANGELADIPPLPAAE